MITDKWGDVVTCESCGETNPSSNEFCSECGAFLDWEDRPAERGRQPVQAGENDPTIILPAVDQSVQSRSGRARSHRPETKAAVEPAGPVASHRSAATGDQVVIDRSQTAAPPQLDCAKCGRDNAPGRRFCSRCGNPLLPSSVSGPPKLQRSPRPSWWSGRWGRREAAARRAYRRSLPPLYRWRRVIIGVCLAALLGVGGVVAVQNRSVAAGRDPIGWLGTRWYDATNALTPVSPVLAAVVPPTGSAESFDPRALTDRTLAEWSMNWNAAMEGPACGAAARNPVVVLTIPAARVRAIEIWPGLTDTRTTEQALQFRPKMVGITVPGRGCRSYTLKNSSDAQLVILDSRVDVTTIDIRVATAYSALTTGATKLSLTEVMVLVKR